MDESTGIATILTYRRYLKFTKINVFPKVCVPGNSQGYCSASREVLQPRQVSTTTNFVNSA